METKSNITPTPPITLENTKYIQGPIALSEYYSAKYGKHIFLFSNEHQRKPKCPKDSTTNNTMSIPDVIDQLITEDPTKIVNVYLEIPYISNSKDRQKNFSSTIGYIGDVASAFASCFLVEKKICPYSNARFHYIDVRNWQEQKDMNSRKLLEAHLHLAVREFNAGEKLSTFNQDEIAKHRWAFDRIDVKDLLSRLKITKQLDNIPEKRVRTAIYTEMMKTLENNTSNNSAWMLDMALRGLTVGKPRGNAGMARMVIDFLQNFGVALMDSYVLARMFRQFQDGSRSYRDIIYAGAYHIENYDKFLVETLGFTRLQTTRDSNDSYQCINIKEFAPYLTFKT